MPTGILALPFAVSALAFCLTAVLMHMGRRRLTRVRDRARGELVPDRDAFYTSAYVDPTRLRAGIPGSAAILLMLALIGVTAVGAVYYAARQPILLVFVAFEGYAVFTQFDSLEAVFYAAFIGGAPPDRLGVKDYEYIRIESEELGRGTAAFGLLALATSALVFFSEQAVAASEAVVEYYVRFVFGVAQLAAPFSRPLSVALVPIVFGGSLVALLFALAQVRARLIRGRPKGR